MLRCFFVCHRCLPFISYHLPVDLQACWHHHRNGVQEPALGADGSGVQQCGGTSSVPAQSAAKEDSSSADPSSPCDEDSDDEDEDEVDRWNRKMIAATLLRRKQVRLCTILLCWSLM